ncbi:MAG: aminoacyl-tRNA hydrolase [Paludibacteraceae bacterium]|nr:aminoacyl-tRNA hydrolase [Paludibacteraceae bacterium]
MERSVKQVIVMRRDLNMRKGKMVAQGAHASVGAFLKLFSGQVDANGTTHISLEYDKDSFLTQWLDGSFAKICLYVDSKEDLVNLYRRVREKAPQIPIDLVQDAGLTEFHGVPTLTCLAIGPYWADEINAFTGDLKLY